MIRANRSDTGLLGELSERDLQAEGRALRPGLKTVFVTGFSSASVDAAGSPPSGSRLLAKPFCMRNSADSVGALLAAGT